MLECAGDVCLYTLVVCSEWLFVVAFSTRCNCCDSYFVSCKKKKKTIVESKKCRLLNAVDGRLLQQCQQLLSAPRVADPGAAERFAGALGIPLDTMRSFLKLQLVWQVELQESKYESQLFFFGHIYYN